MGGKNTITRSVAPKSIFESARNVISAATTFDQGDLLIFDDTTNLLRKPALETEGSTFVGVAKCSLVLGKLASPYNTDVVASQAIADVPGPEYGVIAKCVLKTGETLAPGDGIALHIATGSRGVQNISGGTKQIGIYQGAAVAGSAAGLEIEVLIGCRHPGDSLKF